jgi:arylsulfatase A-like enzyme
VKNFEIELTRRDFLKLISMMPLVVSELPSILKSDGDSFADQMPPNILILVFDALSAYNVSLYGYQRDTTPNLTRFAERATVYHNHYAGGNFTSAGTASLLTGTYPWTHRAFHLHDIVDDNLANRNIFNQFANKGYTRVGYSHNLLATSLLYQFREDIETFKWTRDLCLTDEQYADHLFPNDFNVAFWSEWLTMRGGSGSEPGSLFLSLLQRTWKSMRKRSLIQEYGELFPRGIPNLHSLLFILEDAIDWIMQQLIVLPNPYLIYFHVLPPHEPYLTRRDFIDRFKDGWNPEPKPVCFFSEGHGVGFLEKNRREYDEYIAYADSEFGRLLDSMEKNGTLDNTYVVFTSDHGELFERGIRGHVTPALYEPIIRLPMLISRPGQTERVDVYEPTNCVDLLPTLLHLTGQAIPDWCEGDVLPLFSGETFSGERSVYSVEAKSNPKQAPLENASISLIRGKHKLICYMGYGGEVPTYEMFDIYNDPEERENLASTKNTLAEDHYAVLLEKIKEVNRPYI